MYKREMNRRMDYPRKANTHIIEPIKGGGGGPAMKKDFEKLYIGDPRGVKPKNNEMPIGSGRGLPKTTLKFKY
jgi:hypothetical protein